MPTSGTMILCPPIEIINGSVPVGDGDGTAETTAETAADGEVQGEPAVGDGDGN